MAFIRSNTNIGVDAMLEDYVSSNAFEDKEEVLKTITLIPTYSTKIKADKKEGFNFTIQRVIKEPKKIDTMPNKCIYPLFQFDYFTHNNKLYSICSVKKKTCYYLEKLKIHKRRTIQFRIKYFQRKG